MAHAGDQKQILTIGHSPDPDDAFMWWPLGDVETGMAPAVDIAPFQFRAVPEDIEKLNTRAVETGDLDITAISIHTYPHVKDRYALTSCGASMGDGYGPKLVVPEDSAIISLDDLRDADAVIAIPGLRTSAYLALRLVLEADPAVRAIPFDRIIDAVVQHEVAAGVVIHEGQLTYADAGLRLIADLGEAWGKKTGLPLPLGGNAVRRDIESRFGAGSLQRLAAILSASLEHALDQREQGLDYALGFARGLPQATADQFIAMYVNDLTRDAGPRGARAINEFLSRGAAAGLCPDPGEVDLVTP